MPPPEKRFTQALLDQALSMIRASLEDVDRLTLFEISRVALGFRLEVLNKGVAKLTQLTVRAGPFAGMRYIAQASGSVYAPKLLGTYEAELAPVFTKLSPYTTFIDIGAAEGYYAVGVARAAPHINVIGFDTDLAALESARTLADLNAVSDRIELHGAFDRSLCGDLDPARTLVLIDIEGAEVELLPELLATDLIGATVVVETHVVKGERTEIAVVEALEPSHRIERVTQVSRAPETIPDICELNQFERFLCVWEGRNAEGWIIARPT
ncbi:MAG: hypothetical protein HQ481_08780 [Alphaproteobacteria bacterium]|nr:hypothetical protein [Alphaproteobacteria bacterium]